MAQLVSASRGSGPLIRSKTSPLAVKKRECWRVLTKYLGRDPQRFGKWEAITRGGYLVVAPSYLEACELVFLVGGALFPRPADLDRNDEHDEERYLDWLLTHHFRIEPYQAGQPLEMLFSEFLKGWRPGNEDILKANSLASSVVEPLLRSRWEGR